MDDLPAVGVLEETEERFLPLPSARPAVVAALADLFFVPRFTDVIRAQGGEPVLVESPAEFVDAVDGAYPVLAIVDLSTAGDWPAAIRRCKLRPHTRATPIYAFIPHVEADQLRLAREAGADHAWARSRLMGALPQIVADHVHPPVHYPAGWDETLGPDARRGIEEFNRREWMEQHEWLERAWLEETRPVREMYQGILQVGVALLHVERGNWAGAIKVFRRGLPRLRGLPAICQGVHVAELRTAAEALHAQLAAAGPTALSAVNPGAFPPIRLEEVWPPLAPIADSASPGATGQ